MHAQHPAIILDEPPAIADPPAWPDLLIRECDAAVARERRRFGDDLHDVVASNLHAAGLFIAAARQTLPPGEAGEFLDAAESTLRACWADARRCAAGLRPLALDRRGVVGALAEFVRRVSGASGGVAVTFSQCGAARRFDEAAELALLRVAQEAVTNALRHATPTAVAVELAYDADAVRLEVIDNGHGFDPATQPAGLGLSAMRDRADEVGADLYVHTEPPVGTQVIMTIPLAGGAPGRSENYLG